MPMAADKKEGPVTALIFLGIVVDTVEGELRHPEDKLEGLKNLLQQLELRECVAAKSWSR